MSKTARTASSPSSRWQILSVTLCLLFGTACILNTHPSGDGLWYWYATMFRGGRKLYADMHVPLQPLFVLCTAVVQSLFGISWLASKSLALAQLVAFLAVLFALVRQNTWSDAAKALLLAAAFGMNLMSSYYRFDDYHVTVHIMVLLTIYGLFLLYRVHQPRRIIAIGCFLGVLAGLSLMTRLNDGAALLASGALLLPVFARRSRAITVFTFFGVAALICLIVIALTGDTVHAWAWSTIVQAAGIKGGAGRVLFGPVTFPFVIASHFYFLFLRSTVLCVALVAGAIAFALRRFLPVLGRRLKVAGIVLLGLAVLFDARPLTRSLIEGSIGAEIARSLILLFYAVAIAIVIGFVRDLFTRRESRSPLRLLFLVPFAQLLSGALTSGGSHLEAFPPIAAALALLPLASPFQVNSGWQKRICLGLLAVTALATFVPKYVVPYRWHHYKDATMFANRTWYKHPVFGPMLIEQDQLHVFESMCATMQSDPDGDLLAMPFPYPNYFCDRRPWHGYVQTWYDTTSRSEVDRLVLQLRTPPRWIVYQRAPDTIRSHEKSFGTPGQLPHRAIDRLILQQVSNHAWTVTGQTCLDQANWILIHTVPSSPQATPAPGQFPVWPALVCSGDSAPE